MAKRFSLQFSLFLILSDITLVFAALLLATQARIYLPFGRLAPVEAIILPEPLYVITLFIWGMAFLIVGVYEPKNTTRIINELQIVAQGSMVALLIQAGVLYFTFRQVSRLQTIYFGLFALMLIILHRIVVRGFFRLTGGRKIDARRVLIIGTGETGQEVAAMVRSYAWAGLYLVGFAGDEPSKALSAPVLGGSDHTAEIVKDMEISEVILALSSDAEFDIRQLMHELQWLPLNIRLVPDYNELVFLNLRVEDFGGMPLLSLKEPSLTPIQRLIKRLFDVAVTATGLLFALPVMAVIAVAVRLDSPGPVLLRQERIGEGGEIFHMLKFRTMVENADQYMAQVVKHDENGNVIHKHPDDPRITRVGRWLRKTSLDELPQIINILRGEMSLVGPRPEMPWLVEKYEPWQYKRFEVPQGLTGWWQINGRSDKPMHMHTDEDLFYIRNYSLWLDVEILWRTVGVVLSGRGAY